MEQRINLLNTHNQIVILDALATQISGFQCSNCNYSTDLRCTEVHSIIKMGLQDLQVWTHN